MCGNRALPMPIAILILRVEGWQNGYCTSLENWRPQGLGGSNPSPSVAQCVMRRLQLTKRRSGNGTNDFETR